MEDKAKQSIAVRFMSFWNSLSPEFRYSILYIVAALLTMAQQLLSGPDWKSAVITFIGSLLTLINGFQAVNKVAKAKTEQANLNEPVYGVNLETPLPDTQSVDVVEVK